MKKILALAIVALVVPSVALAGKPSNPGQSQDSHGKSQSASHAPTVLYVLKGVINGFGAGTETCTAGTVAITVARVNHQLAKFEQLPGQPTQPSHPPLSLQLTVCLSKTTKVVVKGSGRVEVANVGTISLGANGNHGIVKVRYAKKFDPTNSQDLQTFLMTGAKQVVVQKPVTG